LTGSAGDSVNTDEPVQVITPGATAPVSAAVMVRPFQVRAPAVIAALIAAVTVWPFHVNAPAVMGSKTLPPVEMFWPFQVI
jgi:hypothetical protein